MLVGPQSKVQSRKTNRDCKNTRWQILCSLTLHSIFTTLIYVYPTFILFSKRTLTAKVVSHVIPSVGCMKLNQQWICLFSLTLGLHIGICLVSLCIENGHSLQYMLKTMFPSSSLVVFFDFETKSNDLQEPRRIKTRDQKQRELGPSY